METIIFKNKDHEEIYYNILAKMANDDSYHRSMAYLLALDSNLRYSERINDCFDFVGDRINPEVLEAEWITGFDRRVLQLAFSLYNSSNAADINDIFSYGNDLGYLLEAIRIRFS